MKLNNGDGVKTFWYLLKKYSMIVFKNVVFKTTVFKKWTV